MSQSSANPTPKPGQIITSPTEPTRATALKPQRVLACVSCQKRKVKCDRNFPCAHCFRTGVHCVPAIAVTTRQRRRRFPERELLERLRTYENLLRQNDVEFEPLHPPSLAYAAAAAAEHRSPSEDGEGPPETSSEVSREKSQETAVRHKDAAVYEAQVHILF